MGAKTNIEWTDATWNPTVGCTSVSAGCDHCYARSLTERFGGAGSFDTMVLPTTRLLAAEPCRLCGQPAQVDCPNCGATRR